MVVQFPGLDNFIWTLLHVLLPGVLLAFHLVSLILSFVFWNRCRKPAVLVMAGSTLSLLVISTIPFLPSIMSIVVGILVVEFGNVFLLMAAFTGRNEDGRNYDGWKPPATPKKDAEITGIRETRQPP